MGQPVQYHFGGGAYRVLIPRKHQIRFRRHTFPFPSCSRIAEHLYRIKIYAFSLGQFKKLLSFILTLEIIEVGQMSATASCQDFAVSPTSGYPSSADPN